jgi:acyl-CoA synthetase (AMP-forming)/AMP-acid ligase II
MKNRLQSAPPTSLPNPLADRLRLRFEARAGEEQITFLKRNAAPVAYTGERLGGEAEALSRALRDWLGDGPRTLVLALPAGERFVTALLACLLGGITVVPVTLPRMGSHSDRFLHIVHDSGASAVLCAEKNLEGILQALSGPDGAPAAPVATLPLDPATLPDPLPPSGQLVQTGQTPAVIQYTSGSTRAPKGVSIMGCNILANCELVMRSWQMDEAARFVNWLPHYHDMGLMGGILYPLLCGGFSAQMSPLDFIRRPELWLRAVSDHRASFSGGPAFAFAECCRRVPAETVAALDLSSWQRAFCGAEPVPRGLLDRFHAHLAPAGLTREAVFPCYGLAEMTLFAAGVPRGPAPRPTPPSGAEPVEPCVLTGETRDGLQIVDPESRTEVTDGTVGEIWLRGPSQGAGYLNLGEETEQSFGQRIGGQGTGEWLRTGDLGIVRDGMLYVTGRIKDIIICNGRKISAPEVEWLACDRHDALNPMAAAAFMADANVTGQVVLVAETRLGQGLDVEVGDLRRAIRRAVQGEWGLELKEILFVPRGRLERTSSGKIRRQAVAQSYREGAFAPFREREAEPCQP